MAIFRIFLYSSWLAAIAEVFLRSILNARGVPQLRERRRSPQVPSLDSLGTEEERASRGTEDRPGGKGLSRGVRIETHGPSGNIAETPGNPSLASRERNVASMP
jgi:hypothetical protein